MRSAEPMELDSRSELALRLILSRHNLTRCSANLVFRLTILAITLISVITLQATSPALGDVVGTACVVDGNTMRINGERSYKRCIGGTEVRLFGIISPNLDQLCDAKGGRKWYCGRASATILLEAVKGKILECRGNTKDKLKRLLVVCYLDGKDLNELLVLNGWSLAYKKHSEAYLEAEISAAGKRKGLWQVMENATFDWRNR